MNFTTFKAKYSVLNECFFKERIVCAFNKDT